jgi:protein-disulfide isomerase
MNLYRRMSLTVATVVIAVLAGQPARPQNQPAEASTDKSEIEQLKEQLNVLREEQLRMRRDLEQIKSLLKRRTSMAEGDPYRGKTVSLGGNSFKGQRDAKITLVEFSDFQCPHCARYARETLPRLEEEFISTGRIKYVFRDLPLERIHKSAFRAAEAANCAGEQGQFWPMHDTLFANRAELGEDKFGEFAKRLGLDAKAFEVCMQERKFKSEVENDMREAQQLSINGTPTFLIGLTRPGSDQITVIRSLRGAVRYEQLKQALDAVLEKL